MFEKAGKVEKPEVSTKKSGYYVKLEYLVYT